LSRVVLEKNPPNTSMRLSPTLVAVCFHRGTGHSPATAGLRHTTRSSSNEATNRSLLGPGGLARSIPAGSKGGSDGHGAGAPRGKAAALRRYVHRTRARHGLTSEQEARAVHFSEGVPGPLRRRLARLAELGPHGREGIVGLRARRCPEQCHAQHRAARHAAGRAAGPGQRCREALGRELHSGRDARPAAPKLGRALARKLRTVEAPASRHAAGTSTAGGARSPRHGVGRR